VIWLACAYIQQTLVSGASTNIAPGVNIPFDFTELTSGNFTFDGDTRAIIINEPGIYLANFSIFVLGTGDPATFAFTVNNQIATSTLFGQQALANNNTLLIGQGLLTLNENDAVRVMNASLNFTTTILPFAGRQVNGASMLLVKVCDLASA
jgi:hypothetical protein